ncbi:MAG: hypothetical protein Q8K36_04455, partial [Alphaproteobacteria bacterium]|nr:hypothetical protein [Alphaproteobacteria bacterium]
MNKTSTGDLINRVRGGINVGSGATLSMNNTNPAGDLTNTFSGPAAPAAPAAITVNGTLNIENGENTVFANSSLVINTGGTVDANKTQGQGANPHSNTFNGQVRLNGGTLNANNTNATQLLTNTFDDLQMTSGTLNARKTAAVGQVRNRLAGAISGGTADLSRDPGVGAVAQQENTIPNATTLTVSGGTVNMSAATNTVDGTLT